MNLIKLTSRAKETEELLPIWFNVSNVSTFQPTDEEKWGSIITTRDHIFGGILVIETPEEIVSKWPL